MKQVNGEKLLASLGEGVKDIRGRITPDAPMDRVTWFRAGGLAELMFQPHDEEDLIAFLKDSDLLLQEVKARRAAIHKLLTTTTELSNELIALVRENKASLAPALAQVRQTIELLNRNKVNLTKTIAGLGTYATELGDAVGSGPFFSAYVPNISNPLTLPFFPKMVDQILSGKGNTP